MILILQIDSDLAGMAGHQRILETHIEEMALLFSTGQVYIRGPLDRVASDSWDKIVGVRWPYFVVLRGELYGPKRVQFRQGYIGRMEDFGQILTSEVYPPRCGDPRQ